MTSTYSHHISETKDLDGFHIAGNKNQAITESYKWDTWRTGQNISKGLQRVLGMPKRQNSIWNLDNNSRVAKMKEWAYELNREKREDLADQMVDLRSLEEDLKALHKVRGRPISK